jgi:exonuclease SbcC
MKILKLKFKNINSLLGEWQIDFTQPQFTDNGLFAITGKTGSGKSSILDAISLALYGKTPRVEITGQNNPVMTRGTSDCSSEIQFEVGGEKWKSSWKQELNRNNNLKPVNRQIADAADKIHADQVRTCDGKIVEILGLSFEQFTKVVLLAQGNFAAFLQAEKNDKGELLEQITGTEIYGEISKKVFERNRTEKDKLEKILVELGAIHLLSEEEITTLENENVGFEEQKTRIDNELKNIENAKKHLADVVDLQEQIAVAKTKLPELERKLEWAKTILLQAEDALKKAKNEKEQTDRLLITVRELDTKISEKERLLKPVWQSMRELIDSKNLLSQKAEDQKKTLEHLQKSLKEKRNWAARNTKYEQLVGQYTAIENQDSQVKNLQNDCNAKQNELVVSEKELVEIESTSKKLQTDFTQKKEALNAKIEEFETKKVDLLGILEGKELNDYQQEKENISNFATQITTLIEVENAIFTNQTEIAGFAECIIAAEQSAKALAIKIGDDRKSALNIEKQIHLLDENIQLVKTVQRFDEYRELLKDGEACPLCGASEHPFARGNKPKIGEKEMELKNLKLQFQAISARIQNVNIELTKTNSEKENALKNKEKETCSLHENKNRKNTVLNEIKKLQSDFSMPDTMAQLEEIRDKKQVEYARIFSLISKAMECEKSIQKLQNEEIPQLRQEKQTAENAKINAETSQKLAEQQVEMKKHLLNDANKSFEEKNTELLEILERYEAENLVTLKRHLDDWNVNQAAIDELSGTISVLNNSLTLINTTIENNQKQLENKDTERQSIETERQKLSIERKEIFGDKSVSGEEQRLKKLLESVEAAKVEAETKRNNFNTEFIRYQAILSEKEKELIEKQEQRIAEKTIEELQVEWDEKKPQSDQISQQIGANNQTLKANEENLNRCGKKLEEKEIQDEICRKWAGLNELIGSSDGKKYRNFAQALTFEYLVDLANRQFQKMSERYLLKRVGDATNPFELSVIDQFQNYDERTVQNLSGGEKFIVSLSLALGLANMASKNMQIDTMFIDEGFGTLDSDYLDVTLTALSNLQNEGKLIGVISHLTELKERIATHIEVISDGNGHSKIEIHD